jgi:sigma-B regulation protein RsbU (phosphoserine phosphatase)
MQKNKVVNNAFETIRTLYENVQSDLAEARRLQASLVRETEHDYEGGHAAMMLHPSGHIGGDLVGQFQINANQIGLYSLDVSGHGVASALMAARLAGYLSGKSPTQNIALIDEGDGIFTARDPADTATRLNDTLLRELETDHYLTMALAVIDLRTGRATCVQAGHPHPVIIRRDGAIEEVGSGGMPIGLLEDIQYESFGFQLKPGDQLLLYSDGLTEAEDPQGAQLEERGLADMLRNNDAIKGLPLLEALHDDLTRFCGTSEFSDDVSALVFEWTPKPAS